MKECATGDLLVRTQCILTYEGKTFGIVLNYTVLAVNVVACAIVTITATNYPRRRQLQRKLFAAAALAVVSAYQVALCLLVGCSGISIVWAACAGWTLSEGRLQAVCLRAHGDHDERTMWCKRHLALRPWQYAVIAVDAATIVYYAMDTDLDDAILSTTAHLCAILLGWILSLVSIKIFFSSGWDASDPAAESLLNSDGIVGPEGQEPHITPGSRIGRLKATRMSKRMQAKETIKRVKDE